MKKGDRTRQRIIETAATLFNERGYAGCSMSDIMEATGLEKGAIYRYFPSKEALAIEALHFAISEVNRVRLADHREFADSIGKLRQMIQLFVTTPSPVRGGCPLLNTAIEADDGNTVLRAIAKAGFSEWRQRIAAIAEQGIVAGEIRPGLKAAEIADMIIAALEGGLMLSRVEGNRSHLEHVQKLLTQLVDSLALTPVSPDAMT